ncbi:flagellar M-ring protein FliF C-terminal domain-containing protein [Shigella flexneri]
MKQIAALTREAMGFSDKRGDTLNVVNSPFTADRRFYRRTSVLETAGLY